MSRISRAERAGSFGRVVDDYERGRPGYPEEVVEWLIEGARRVVDLAAGTGKLTASLARRGRAVIAIEPQEQMLSRLRQTVAGAHVVCAGAEALPVKEGWADAVVVAQAFHWFDLGRALPEIARTLRPGGRLGLLWNVRDDSVEWIAELARIAGGDNSKQTREALRQLPYFGAFESRKLRTVQTHDRESLLAHVRSRSNVAAMSETKRLEVVDAVVRLCDTHPDLAGRDRFEFPYLTEAYRAKRT